jgi:predicted nucleic acid-binding protein
MRMTESKVLVDSSIWLAYFLASADAVKNIIDSSKNMLYTSAVTLHEVKRKLLRMDYTSRQAEKATQFIRENSIVIPVDDKIALESVAHCLKNKLHTIDSIIYETAIQNNCKLVTADKDFKNMKDAILV